MKDILVPFGGAKGSAALSAAVRLAENTGARINGMIAQPDPAMAIAWVGPAFAGTLDARTVDKVREAQNELDRECEALFREATAKLSTDARYERSEGLPDVLISDRATLNDLTIFAHDDVRGETQLSATFERVLMDNRQPVLIAPTEEANWIENPIAVAWDGGPEVARAVAAAWPLIELKGRVTLIQFDKNIEADQAYSANLETAAEWFERRGIDVDVKSLSGRPSERMLDTVADLKAGLLITGAYGHNRAREFFFGGMTRTLLKTETEYAVLLCH